MKKSRLKSLFRRKKSGSGGLDDTTKEAEKARDDEDENDIHKIPSTAPTTPEKEYSKSPRSESVRSDAFCRISETGGGHGNQVVISSISLAPSISTGGGKESTQVDEDVINRHEIISMVKSPSEAHANVPTLKKPFVMARSQLKKLGQEDEKSIGSTEAAAILEKATEGAQMEETTEEAPKAPLTTNPSEDVKTEYVPSTDSTPSEPPKGTASIPRFSMVNPDFLASLGLGALSPKGRNTEASTEEEKKELKGEKQEDKDEDVRSIYSLEEGIECSLDDTLGSDVPDMEKPLKDRHFVSPSSSFSSIAWESRGFPHAAFEKAIQGSTATTGFEAIAVKNLELPQFEGNATSSEKNNSPSSEGHSSANAPHNNTHDTTSTSNNEGTNQDQEQDRASNVSNSSFFGIFPRKLDFSTAFDSHSEAQEEKKECDSTNEYAESNVTSLATTSTATKETNRISLLSQVTNSTLRMGNLGTSPSRILGKIMPVVTDVQTSTSKEDNGSDNDSIFEGVDKNGFPKKTDQLPHEFQADFSEIEQEFHIVTERKGSPAKALKEKPEKSQEEKKQAESRITMDGVVPIAAAFDENVEMSMDNLNPDEIDWTAADLGSFQSGDDATLDNTTKEHTVQSSTDDDQTELPTPDIGSVDDTKNNDRTTGDQTVGDSTNDNDQVDDTAVENSTYDNHTVDDTTIGNSTHGDRTVDDATVGNSTYDNRTVDDTTVGNSTYDNRTVDDTTVGNSTYDNRTVDDTTVGNSTHDHRTTDDTTGHSRDVKKLPDDGSTADRSKDVGSIYSHDSSQMTEAKTSTLAKKHPQGSRWTKSYQQKDRFVSDDERSEYTMETNRGAYADDEKSHQSRGSQFTSYTQNSKQSSSYYTKFSYDTTDDDESQYTRESKSTARSSRRRRRDDRKRFKSKKDSKQDPKENLSTMDELAEMAKELKEEGASAFIKWLDLR